MVGASGWGQGSGELLFNEHSTSVGEDKNSGGGWWRCLQNKMNVHIVTERMVETVNFTVCMFSHNNRNWRRKRQALQVNSFSALTLVPEISGDCLPLCHWGQGTAPTPQSQRLCTEAFCRGCGGQHRASSQNRALPLFLSFHIIASPTSQLCGKAAALPSAPSPTSKNLLTTQRPAGSLPLSRNLCGQLER